MVATPSFCGLYRQIIAGSAASLSALAAAAVFGWLAPSLPKLLSADSEVPMTTEEASWMVTMPEFGNLFSPIPAGILADHFGRKKVILISGPVFLTGWSILLYFKTLLALNIARIIQGIGIGIVFAVVPTYLGEIATPKFRGMVTSTFYCSWWFGYLFEYIVGPNLSFMTFTYVTALTNVIFLLAFAWQPESPYYYLLKNDEDRAEQSLSWFLCTSKEEIKAELARIKQSIEEDKKNKVRRKDLFLNLINRKCMLILFLMGFLRIFCGLLSLCSYSTETLTNAKDYFFLSPDNVTIAMGIMMCVGTFCSFFTLDLFGRISLLFFSCFLSGLCMLSVGTFYLLKSHSSIDVSFLSWVPPVGLIIFSITAVIGIFPVSTTYPSELFDTTTRATASSVMTVFTTMVGFFLFKTYLPISNLFGVFVNFYIYAFVCFLGAILSCTIMPETKGKSFEQIREIFQKKETNSIFNNV